MTKNLPNYYIILRVQPNASQEAIKASYRRLMVTMKMHPDLGGNHDLAAQINQAYEVLSDKTKRERYDRLYLIQRLRAAQAAARHMGGRAAVNASGRTNSAPASRMKPFVDSAKAKGEGCPFCEAPLPPSIKADTRCGRCRSPLSAPLRPGAFGRELFGRRASPRTPKSHFGTIQVAGQSESFTVKMRDLSLTGISFYAEIDLAIGQVFKFRDVALEAVAVVVLRRKRGQWYSIHAKLLSVAFHHKAGIFVSASH